MKKIIILFCFSILSSTIYGQVLLDNELVGQKNYNIVSAINIKGNKKTKDYVILREMPFKVGDTILKENTTKLFLQAKIQVYNNNLFIEVNIDSTVLSDESMVVNLNVKERWYIFPTPQFLLSDRNFNEWYTTFNADLKRVVYGIDFSHYNFSGRRDNLDITVLNGYARNISFSYSNPYSNTKLTEGFSVYGSYLENKETVYKTSTNNFIRTFKTGGFVRKSFNVGGGYSRRKSFFKRSGISINLNFLKVNDSIITTKYNSNYFDSDKSKQFIIDIGYFTTYANTDKNAYPLKGTKYSYGISKRGFGFSGGINSTSLSGFYSKYVTHSHNFYSNAKVVGLIKLPFKQAFINQRAIGYGLLNMRGLDLHVIDGVASGVFNYTLSKKIISFKIPIPFNIKAFPYIPFTIFAKTYADFGYSYLPSQYYTLLNNKFLRTGGVGIDVLSLYDSVLKIEYSYNQLNEKGLFLQISSSF